MDNSNAPAAKDTDLPPRQEIISALLDAQDSIGWARSLIEALQGNESRATVAVAHHALERLEDGLEILKSLTEAVK